MPSEKLTMTSENYGYMYGKTKEDILSMSNFVNASY